MEGVISTGNSTTTLLLASTAFTGVFEQCEHFTEIMVSIYQKEFAFNVRVNWSNDGVTVWDSEILTALPTRGAASMSFIRVPVRASWYRISYSNGTSNQTVFSLQTIAMYTGSFATLAVPKIGKVEFNGELYDLKIAYVNAATGPATYTIVAAVANKTIRALHANLVVNIAGSVQVQLGASVLINPMAFAALGQINYRASDNMWWGFYSGGVGSALQLVTLGASQIVRGSVTYIESNT